MSARATAGESSGGLAAALARLDSPQRESDPLWMHKLRKEARESFDELGLPTRWDESWRQTPVEEITRLEARAATGDEPAAAPSETPLDALELTRLAVRDGRSWLGIRGAPLPEGVWAGPLSEALATRPEMIEPFLGKLSRTGELAFAALNGSQIDDGLVVLIDAGVVVEAPILLAHESSAGDAGILRFPRTLIVVGEGARATVVERYEGGGASVSFTCAVAEAHVAANGSLEHVRIIDESAASLHSGEVEADIARDARYRSLVITHQARLARYDVGARLTAPGGEAVLDGLYLPRGEQHVDHQTFLDHAAPHCSSHEHYKGVLGGRSRAVFNGRIIVREGAQKTNAVQNNRNLLLSEGATVHTRPQLEIYADDVKCTHGATIGQLDRDAAFYLRARGIGRDEARTMLLRAFAADIVHGVAHVPLRDAL